MIILDVTDTLFIDDLSVEEANDWMNTNVGATIHEAWDYSYGEGWRLEFETRALRWILQIEEESKAILFQLRWG